MRRVLQEHGIRPCKELYLKICALICGITSTLLLTIAIGTNHWIYMEEAIPLDPEAFMREGGNAESVGIANVSAEQPPPSTHPLLLLNAEPGPGTESGPGEVGLGGFESVGAGFGDYTLETLVRVHSGLWKLCLLQNELMEYDELPADAVGAGSSCERVAYKGQVWNKRIEGSDTIFSILRAMRRSVFAIAASLLFMMVAQIIGTIGILRRNLLTLVGGVLMIIAALFLATGLVLYITAVNDEVGHRKKPKVGDDASFSYQYSWGFGFAAVAYLGSNVAAVANIYLYQKRFNQHFEDLAEIVPGLEGIIAEIKQTYRRNSNSNFSKEMFVSENPVIVV